MAIDILTIRGGLPRDAKLRFTPSGAAVTNFSVGQRDSRYNEQTSKWETTREHWVDVTIWNESSERKQNPVPWAELASNLTQGDQVIVVGKYFTDKFQDKQGNNRSQNKFIAQEFYVSGKNVFGDTQQQAPNSGFSQQQPPQQNIQQAQNNVQQAMGGQPAANDPWNSAPGVQGALGDNEPPF